MINKNFLFLSHLSGDEAVNHAPTVANIFLSHLSGDEVAGEKEDQLDAFLSHLSGDEVAPILLTKMI